MPSLLERSEQTLAPFVKRACHPQGSSSCPKILSLGARVGIGIVFAILVAGLFYLFVFRILGLFVHCHRRPWLKKAMDQRRARRATKAAEAPGQGAAPPVGLEQASFLQSQQDPKRTTQDDKLQGAATDADYAYPPQMHASAYAPPPGQPPSEEKALPSSDALPPIYVYGNGDKAV